MIVSRYLFSTSDLVVKKNNKKLLDDYKRQEKYSTNEYLRPALHKGVIISGFVSFVLFIVLVVIMLAVFEFEEDGSIKLTTYEIVMLIIWGLFLLYSIVIAITYLLRRRRKMVIINKLEMIVNKLKNEFINDLDIRHEHDDLVEVGIYKDYDDIYVIDSAYCLWDSKFIYFAEGEYLYRIDRKQIVSLEKDDRKIKDAVNNNMYESYQMRIRYDNDEYEILLPAYEYDLIECIMNNREGEY